jgi:hypothetical protein
MRRKIGPGHAGRIAFRQGVDRLEPLPPRRISRQGAALHRGIERIKLLARFGAAGGEFRRGTIKVDVVQSRTTVVDQTEACDSALDFDAEIAILAKVFPLALPGARTLSDMTRSRNGCIGVRPS